MKKKEKINTEQEDTPIILNPDSMDAQQKEMLKLFLYMIAYLFAGFILVVLPTPWARVWGIVMVLSLTGLVLYTYFNASG